MQSGTNGSTKDPHQPTFGVLNDDRMKPFFIGLLDKGLAVVDQRSSFRSFDVLMREGKAGQKLIPGGFQLFFGGVVGHHVVSNKREGSGRAIEELIMLYL